MRHARLCGLPGLVRGVSRTNPGNPLLLDDAESKMDDTGRLDHFH